MPTFELMKSAPITNHNYRWLIYGIVHTGNEDYSNAFVD